MSSAAAFCPTLQSYIFMPAKEFSGKGIIAFRLSLCDQQRFWCSVVGRAFWSSENTVPAFTVRKTLQK